MTEEIKTASIPGIKNMYKHQDEQEANRRKQETGAAIVVQKNFRAFRARKEMRRMRQMNKHRIEYEYEALNRELKSKNDYNLKQYLHEKKSLRDQMGFAKDESHDDSIADMVGQS